VDPIIVMSAFVDGAAAVAEDLAVAGPDGLVWLDRGSCGRQGSAFASERQRGGGLGGHRLSL
jgi:hypothetical protein